MTGGPTRPFLLSSSGKLHASDCNQAGKNATRVHLTIAEFDKTYSGFLRWTSDSVPWCCFEHYPSVVEVRRWKVDE